MMGIALKVAGNSTRIRGQTIRAVWIDEVEPKNPWQKYKIKLLPKKINRKWYKPGSWVYRRWVTSPGGGYWQYGDDFDYLGWRP